MPSRLKRITNVTVFLIRCTLTHGLWWRHWWPYARERCCWSSVSPCGSSLPGPYECVRGERERAWGRMNKLIIVFPTAPFCLDAVKFLMLNEHSPDSSPISGTAWKITHHLRCANTRSTHQLFCGGEENRPERKRDRRKERVRKGALSITPLFSEDLSI